MKRKWLLLAFLLTFTLPAAALCAPELLEALWWRSIGAESSAASC